MPSRRRLASISVMIALRDRPLPFGSFRDWKKTLVAITTSSRLAKSRIARPRISSLVPSEYELAVSKKLIPSSRARAKNGRLCSSSSVQAMGTPLRHAVAHAAEADPRDLQSGLAQIPIFHGLLPVLRRSPAGGERLHHGSRRVRRRSIIVPAVKISPQGDAERKPPEPTPAGIAGREGSGEEAPDNRTNNRCRPGFPVGGRSVLEPFHSPGKLYEYEQYICMLFVKLKSWIGLDCPERSRR